MKEQFDHLFLKDSNVPSGDVYEIYASAAKKLWDKYSDTYELRPKSPKKVKEAKNREVEFYKDGKHIAQIAIGKTTTIYVLDDFLRSKLRLVYNQAPNGRYRHTFDTFEECMEAIEGVM